MANKDLITEHFTSPTHQFDLAFAPHTVVSKLDADQYMAEDLDGGTESLFGSGNLNFLAMQAAQTNQAMLNVSENAATTNAPESFAPNLTPAHAIIPDTASDAVGSPFMNAGWDAKAAEAASSTGGALLLGDRTSSSQSLFGGSNGSDGIGDNGFNGTSGISGLSGISGTSGTDGTSAQPGLPGQNGNNGNNGKDGGPGEGTTIINIGGDNTLIDLTEIINHIDNTVNNVTNVTNEIVEQLGDIITNITNIDILIQIRNIIDNILGPENNPDHDLNLDLGITGPLLTSGPLDAALDQLLNPIEDIVGDFDIGLGGQLDLFGDDEISNAEGDSDLNALLDGNLLSNNLLQTDLSVALDVVESLTGDIDLDVVGALNVLGPLADPLIDAFDGGSGGPLGEVGSTLTNIAAPVVEPLLGNTNIDLGGNIDLLMPGNYDNAAGDTDLNLGLDTTALGVPLDPLNLDVPLDTVEAIAGDIDLNLNVIGDLANQTGELGPVGDLLGSITGGNHADTDVGLGSDITVAGIELPDLNLSPQLDIVEDLAGDLDLQTDLGLDLLGNSQTSNAAGDTDIMVNTQIQVVDHALAELSPHVPLDIVEQVTGDIDLNIGLSDNVLGNVAAPVVDSAAGGTGTGLLADIGDQLDYGVQYNFTPEWQQIFSTVLDTSHQLDAQLDQITTLLNSAPTNGVTQLLDTANLETASWPESVLPHGGEQLADLFGNGSLHALPDPVSDVTSGLSGILDHATGNTPLHKLGGLFG